MNRQLQMLKNILNKFSKNMRNKFVFFIGCLLIISCNKNNYNLYFNYSDYSEVDTILPSDSGFKPGIFYSYQHGVASDLKMTYKFNKVCDSNYYYNYTIFNPITSPKADTISFYINYLNTDSSYLIKKDVFELKVFAGEFSYLDSVVYKIKIDTFPLTLSDTIKYFDSVTSKIQTIYRFNFNTGDYLCQTVFANPQFGVFKRYGPVFSDCVEQYYPYGTLNHRAQINMINQLYLRKDFHNICGYLTALNIERFAGVTKYPTRPLVYSD